MTQYGRNIRIIRTGRRVLHNDLAGSTSLI